MAASAVEQYLKRNYSGESVVRALRRRLEIHLSDPKQDNLSRRVWKAYNKLPELVEEPFSILDAGCMSGFLYHTLKRRGLNFSYVGLDRWPEAIRVAREMAPEATFVEGDLMGAAGEYDYVWCSNLPWRGDDDAAAVRHLSGLARKALIFVTVPGNGSPWEHMPGCEIIDCGTSTLSVIRYGS